MHGALETVGSLDQEAIAHKVAHSIVHVLEIIDIDDHEHRHFLGRLVAAPLDIGLDLLGEIGPVGQARQRIVVRHEVDALLGADTLGDVLEQQHDAPLAGTDRDFAVAGIGDLDDGLAAALAVDDLHELFGRARGNGATTAGRRDKRGERAAGPVAGDETLEDLFGAAIDHRDQAVGIEHCEAVMHGVERRIELQRQPAGFDARMNRAEQDVADVAREELEREQHRQQQRREDGMVDVALEEEACSEKAGRNAELDREQPVEAEIARADAHHAGNRRGHGDQLGERIVDEQEAAEAPDAAIERHRRAPEGRTQFPFLRRLDIGGSDAGLEEAGHRDVAEDGDQHEDGRDGPQEGRPGLEGCGARANSGGQHSRNHRAAIGIGRAHHRHIVDRWHRFAGWFEHEIL